MHIVFSGPLAHPTFSWNAYFSQLMTILFLSPVLFLLAFAPTVYATWSGLSPIPIKPSLVPVSPSN